MVANLEEIEERVQSVVVRDVERAVDVARKLLRVPNVDSRSDLAILAEQYLRLLGLN